MKNHTKRDQIIKFEWRIQEREINAQMQNEVGEIDRYPCKDAIERPENANEGKTSKVPLNNREIDII